MIANGAFTKLFAMIFVSFLDSVAYLLVSLSYNIFLAVTKLDLFGGSESGQAVYEMFTQKIYMVLSVVMLFVFAYELILMIINPDGDGVKKTTGIIKNTVISIALVVVLPIVFKYMQVFQIHVIDNNTIGAIVLGTSPTDSSANGNSGYGDTISTILLVTFLHPQGSGYNDFFNTLGDFVGIDEAKNNCLSHGEANEETCQIWAEAMEKYWNTTHQAAIDAGGYSAITWNSDIRGTIGDDDGTYYMWIISTGCAILVAYFFASYAIDLGTRAVKLGFLELIAPVPVMLRIIPKMEKSFKTWQGELIKTYVELFIRVAVIFFIVKLCTLVPEFVDIIFSSGSNVDGGLLLKGITMSILILGLLKFAKEAPELFKSIMDTGGNLFKGINFKPGVRKRISDNEYAMKGLSAAVGGGAGVIGNFMERRRLAGQNADGTERTRANGIGRTLAALSATPRGLITGAKSGLQKSATELNKASLTNVVKDANAAAHASLQQAYDGNLHSTLRETSREIADSNVTNAESIIVDGAQIIVKNGKEYVENLKDNQERKKEERKAVMEDFKEFFDGSTEILSDKSIKRLTDIQTSFNNVSNFTKNAFDKKVENINKAESDFLKEVAKKGFVEIKDSAGSVVNTLNSENAVKSYFNAQKVSAKASALNEQKMNAISSQYKEISKLFERDITQDNLNQINKRIEKEASKAGISGVKNLDELIKFTSGSAASNNTADFVRAMGVMEDVNKAIGDIKATNELYRSNQETMKKAQKDDKK